MLNSYCVGRLWPLSLIIEFFIKIVKVSHPINVGFSLFQISDLDFLLRSPCFVFFLDRIQPFLFKLLSEALSFADMGESNALDHLMVQFHSLAMSLVYRF
jgi:hypothetical protein